MARRRLPKGWTEGSVQELLGLTDAEAVLVEVRVRLAERVRERRRAKRLTQRELAERIGSTQPRVAKLEQAGASIEMLMRALLALGADRKEIARLLAA
ncbi:MAG TPA: XRE family transcriptional regulator [Myxococcota bacterium]|nr:XRE family transcriptional regulator [Myxococcota bacterium]